MISMSKSNRAALLAFALLPAVFAQSVVLLPPAPAGTSSIANLTDQLASGGTIPSPPAPIAAFITADGRKQIYISNSPTETITFADLPLGSANARRVSISTGAKAAALTPDGRKLVVAGDGLRILDVTTETEVTGALSSGVILTDLAISLDSHYAYAISVATNTFYVIDLNQYVVSQAVPLPGPLTGVAVAPNANVYVSQAYQISEIDWRTFTIRSTISVNARPGKLSFTPDGKYAVAVDQLLNGQSVVLIDILQKKSLAGAGVTIGGGTDYILMDYLYVASNATAYAYSSRVQKIYKVSFLPLTMAEFSVAVTGVPTGVLSMALSNELPASKGLYYNTTNTISRVDLLTTALTGSATAPSAGTLRFLDPGYSTSTVQLLGYNTTQNLIGGDTSQALVVRAIDLSGHPVQGAVVVFTAPTSLIQLSSATSITNSQGFAMALATAPLDAGVYTINAALQSAANVSTAFTLTVTAASPGGGGGGGGGGKAGLFKVSGDGQLSLAPGGGLDPMIVELRDANGNPIPSATISWASGNGMAYPSATASSTDLNGRASMTYTFSVIQGGSDAYGIGTIMASAGNFSVQFGQVGIPASAFTPAINQLVPENQVRLITGKIGQTLTGAIKIRATSSGGAGTAAGIPIGGLGVEASTEFDVTNGPVAKCAGGMVFTSTTDGTATCDLVLTGKTGDATITLKIGNAFQFTFNLTATVGDPTAPKIISGNNQTGKPGADISTRLIAEISDAYGNPFVGVPVTWESVTPTAVTLVQPILITDYNGRTGTQLKLGNMPGTFDINVKYAGKVATFKVTVAVDLASITIVSGNDNPVVEVNQQFPKPLVVKVKDTTGAGVANITVNWSLISGSATLSATSSVTDSAGQAQIQVSAGPSSGAITVAAGTGTLPVVVFNLNSKPAPPPKPPVDAGSFTNFVTGQVGVAPGSLVLLRGRGLARNTNVTVAANLQLATLPIKLGGVVVGFGPGTNMAFAPIFWVMPNPAGEDAVLLQVPFEVSSTAATTPVTVQVDGMDSITVNDVKVAPVAPGILENVDSTGRKFAVATRADGTVISPASGVKRNSRIRIWVFGLGQTSPAAGTNRIGIPNQAVLGKVIVGLDTQGFEAVSASMAQNLIGIYEVVVDIPATVQTGTYRPLSISVEDAARTRYFSQTTSINIIE